jgi:hypothetical protein
VTVTPRIDLHDILEFIWDNIESVNSVLVVHRLPLPLGDYRGFNEILALLSLVSHAMDVRSRMLCKVIPSIEKVVW